MNAINVIQYAQITLYDYIMKYEQETKVSCKNNVTMCAYYVYSATICTSYDVYKHIH
jgi:molybdenum cofactor biosynthesis enzyme